MTSTVRPLDALVHPSWAEVLVDVEPAIRAMGDFLRQEAAAGRGFLPAGDRVFAALAVPVEQVKVLLVGQDPYPTPGHAIGLSFAVAPHVQPLPRSLVNIVREYVDDLGLPSPANGDLGAWARQGVLLLNRSLTVRPHAPGSHRGKGWETVTTAVIDALARRRKVGSPLVAVLWGRDAQSVAPKFDRADVVASAHPSPMSADRGFFGSRPFSRVNARLVEQGGQPVDWRLPSA